MELFTYNIEDFPLKEIVTKWFGKELHLLHKEKKYDVFERKTDQQTKWHKIFYDNVRSSEEWKQVYKSFVSYVIKEVRYKGQEIVYQKIPTFRIQFPNNIGVGEWHKDMDYREDGWMPELNYFVPLTDAVGTSTVWVEGKRYIVRTNFPGENVSETPDTPAFSLDSYYGDCWEWDGLNRVHGNVENQTGKTRVSFDFRVHLMSEHQDKRVNSINTNTPFTIGGYYEVM